MNILNCLFRKENIATTIQEEEPVRNWWVEVVFTTGELKKYGPMTKSEGDQFVMTSLAGSMLFELKKIDKKQRYIPGYQISSVELIQLGAE